MDDRRADKMEKEQTNWFVVAIPVALLVGLFFLWLRRTPENGKVKGVGSNTGTLEFIPTISQTETGTVEMKLRYVPIAQGVDIYKYIYERDELAISDSEYTELYRLKLVSGEDWTRKYRVERVVGGTFMRVLSMPTEILRALTTPSDIEYVTEEVGYSSRVYAENGAIYLYITPVIEE